MRVGDEYVVRMAGPWDGPVRVVERTPTSLPARDARRAPRGRPDPLLGPRARTACSCSRSSRGRAAPDGWCDLLYDRLRMAKEVQLHMWTSMLQRVAEHGRRAGHRRHRHPHAARRRNRRVPESPSGSPALRWPPAQLRPGRAASPSPRAGGSTTTASRCRASRRARRVTAAVRGRADAAARLQGRRPEHRARPLRRRRAARGPRHAARAALPGLPHASPAAASAGSPTSSATVDGRPVRVWGWPYRTLEGHIEQGEMSWEVWKWLDTRRRRVPHPLLLADRRRREPVHGHRRPADRPARAASLPDSACRRMRELTIDGLRGEHPAGAEAHAA